jgi:hypothetical protein
MKKSTKNITFVIRPTEYEVYDILAIGDYSTLYTYVNKTKQGDLIKHSKFGGIPILILDTCETLKDTMNCIKQCKELSETIQNENNH